MSRIDFNRFPEPTPHDLAERIRELFATNPFSAPLGIDLLECASGHSVLALSLSERCMNAHGTGHGGAIWTLADMAFGAAGYYDGQILTTFSTLTFVRPALPGQRLIATGRETTRSGRTGHFEVIIKNGLEVDGKVIAFGQFSGQWLRYIDQKSS